MSKLQQSYFHKDLGFDYEKFFYSVLSFTDPIFYGYKLKFTSTFIYKDEKTGKAFARYKLRDEFYEKKNFLDEKEYLEDYEIYLDEVENAKFSVYQVYNQFEELTIDGKNNGPLRRQSLTEYFGTSKGIFPGVEQNVSGYPKNVDYLLKVEKTYVKLLLEGFNIETSYFLPLPIIAFGNHVGMVYFLYDEDTIRPQFQHGQGGVSASFQNHYRSIILQVTREYERIILENRIKTFYLKPGDPLENYKEIFKDLNMRQDKSHKKIEYKFYYPFRWGELSQRIITENKFLLELGYDDYYNHLGQVITKEGMQLQQTKLEQVKTAIIAIIVDSFAHNIGAHSLVALKWWFEVRYSAAAQQLPLHAKLETQINTKEIHKKIKDRMKDTIDFHSKMDDFDHKVHTDTIALLNIVRFMDKDMEDGLLKYIGRKEEPEEDLIAKFPVPVAQSIYHFFQYLRDKSAFWSGVTRDTLFSGRIRRWDRIFRTFLNNTLFLGTIAHSEGINKIRFHVEILTPESKPEKNKPKILIGGEYAEINLEIIKKESGQYVDNGLPEKNNNDYSDYAFLRKGADFDEIDSYLREELEAVYLPNGIIGQHALYTLIENTLRNIKHYKWLLPQLRQEGVTLCISIQEVPFLKRMDDNLELFQKDYTSITKYNWTSEKPLYKIGAWLHHPQKLLNPVGAFVNEEYTTEGTDTKSYAKFHKKGSVIGSHTQQLRRRVVNEKGNPVLGGSSQDKVCASMLLNNVLPPKFRTVS